MWPDIDLKEELRGSYVTHNHPDIKENINTFTVQDRNLFYNSKLEVLRGVKGDYIFEMNKDKDFKEKIPSISQIEENQMDIDYLEKYKIFIT